MFVFSVNFLIKSKERFLLNINFHLSTSREKVLTASMSDGDISLQQPCLHLSILHQSLCAAAWEESDYLTEITVESKIT